MTAPAASAKPAGVLTGQVALVTGAAGGIGAATVQRFLAAGATVHGVDREAAAGARLAAAAGAEAAGRLVFHAVDLTAAGAVDRVVDACLARAGRIDVLVNNAGISVVASLADSDDALLARLLDINLAVPYRLCRRVASHMLAAGRGVILNTASELATVGMAGYSAYCASKGGVLAFTRALAVELGPRGIRVNALCPGPTDTPMLRAELQTFPDPEAERRANEATIPLGRLGRAAEIAEVALFLVSPAAAFVHGAAILADGGKTAL